VTYLAAGRPIIASVNPDSEVARVALESGAGRVAAAEDAEAMLAAIQELRKTDLRTLGENGRSYAANRWAPDRVLSQLEASLSTVAASRLRRLPPEGALP